MSIFKFKHFEINQSDSAMKVGTDAMILGSFIDSTNCKNGLDIGSGTGVLSMMIAQVNPEIKIEAIELDEMSAKESSINFEKSDWSSRLFIINSNFLDFDSDKSFDLIFSNPPYFQSRLKNNDERKALARHEDSLPIKPFIAKVNKLLSEEGSFWIIIPFDDFSIWNKEFIINNLFLNRKIKLIGKRGGDAKRLILVYKKNENSFIEEHLIIRDENGDYTSEYIRLTKAFHGKEL